MSKGFSKIFITISILLIISILWYIITTQIYNREGFDPPPKKCNGGGWTDPDPASNKRHFKCERNNKGKSTGFYLAAEGGYCPSNLNNNNGVCK